MKKVLILGSNFGAKTYVKAIRTVFTISEIDIVSPNIYKKNISYKNINKFRNYKKLVNKKTYDLIICAVSPKIQNQFLEYSIKILKNKKTRLMLEKPLSQNFNKIFNNLNNLKKNNIIFSQNFIFTKINEWDNFIKSYKKKDYSDIVYNWNFKQAYFINKKKTWKTNSSQGGGILLYYMPHIFFNLLNLNFDLKLLEINVIKKTSAFFTELAIEMKSLKKKININININAKKKTHFISAKKDQNTLILKNNTKDWTKGFRFIKNHKVIKISKENRIQLTAKNIKELMNFKISSKKYHKFLKLVEKTYKLLNLINKRIYG